MQTILREMSQADQDIEKLSLGQINRDERFLSLYSDVPMAGDAPLEEAFAGDVMDQGSHLAPFELPQSNSAQPGKKKSVRLSRVHLQKVRFIKLSKRFRKWLKTRTAARARSSQKEVQPSALVPPPPQEDQIQKVEKGPSAEPPTPQDQIQEVEKGPSAEPPTPQDQIQEVEKGPSAEPPTPQDQIQEVEKGPSAGKEPRVDPKKPRPKAIAKCPGRKRISGLRPAKRTKPPCRALIRRRSL